MAKRTRLPIALSGAGLLGLLASWACFPPVPLAGGTTPTAADVPTVRATTRPASPRATDGSASPAGSTAPTSPPSAPVATTSLGPPVPGTPGPVASAPAAPVMSAPASPASPPAASPAPGPFGDLTPIVARTYAYRTTGAGAGQLFVAVTAVAGPQVGYRSQSVFTAGSPPPPQTGTATLTNGVYWIFPDRPNPVTAAIATYPTETVAVPAGTGLAAKVVAGAETYWFVAGVIVKAVTAAGTTELQAIQ